MKPNMKLNTQKHIEHLIKNSLKEDITKNAHTRFFQITAAKNNMAPKKIFGASPNHFSVLSCFMCGDAVIGNQMTTILNPKNCDETSVLYYFLREVDLLSTGVVSELFKREILFSSTLCLLHYLPRYILC